MPRPSFTASIMTRTRLVHGLRDRFQSTDESFHAQVTKIEVAQGLRPSIVRTLESVAHENHSWQTSIEAPACKITEQMSFPSPRVTANNHEIAVDVSFRIRKLRDHVAHRALEPAQSAPPILERVPLIPNGVLSRLPGLLVAFALSGPKGVDRGVGHVRHPVQFFQNRRYLQ